MKPSVDDVQERSVADLDDGDEVGSPWPTGRLNRNDGKSGERGWGRVYEVVEESSTRVSFTASITTHQDLTWKHRRGKPPNRGVGGDVTEARASKGLVVDMAFAETLA
jgi:hypothetical protein